MARRIEKINEGWELEKQGEMMAVNLPHTWNAQDGQTGPDMYFRGECIYRRQLKKPELKKGEQVYIEFRGVNSSAAVRMNGTELMCHDGGYSTFRVNVTDVLKDENILEVLVDNAPNDRVYPQRADFTFYGGIYRDVYLIVTDPSHFDLDYYGGRGLRITPEIDGENAVVHFETYSVGEVERILVSVAGVGETELTLETRDGKTYGKGSIALPGVHRWDALNDPYLYEAMAVLYRGGRAELIPNELGEYKTVSAVSVLENGTVLVGAAAKERLVSHPEASASSFKIWMGTEKALTLAGRRFKPEELSALVLRQLLEDAKRYLGKPVEEAVISVPAYFNDDQRCATKLAT